MTEEQLPAGDGAVEVDRFHLVTVHDPGCGFLTSNQRLHWRVRNARTQSWRAAAGWAARHARLPRLQRAHIVATVHERPLSRRRDVANVYPTVKAIVDGLVTDLRLLPDDSDAYLVGPDLRRGDPVPKDESRRIVLTIRPLPAPQETP
ncbi:hypothetical protein [Thalassiella azotivora]